MGDIGIRASTDIIDELRKRVKEERLNSPAQCREVLIDTIKRKMDLGENAYEFENRKSVVFVIGVNGVGKTTSVGKLASQIKND